MASKSIKDVLVEDGEVHPPKVRGAVQKWIEVREDFNYKEDRGTIPVDLEHGVASAAFRDFRNFLDCKLDESWHSEISGTDLGGDIKQEFFSYWSDNDELIDRFKEIAYWTHEGSILVNIKAADERGGIHEMIDKHGMGEIATEAGGGDGHIDEGSGSDSGEGGQMEDGQSSFGESRFPELYDVGVVDDEGNCIESKLRGLVMAFADDVDEIRGSDREFSVEWAQKAFLYWGVDRFGDEWYQFVQQVNSWDGVYDSVDWVCSNRDDVENKLRKKYVGNCDMSAGNQGTDDVSEAFLDAEVPGWDEEEEKRDGGSTESKWDKFEEESKKKDNDYTENRENGGPVSDDGSNSDDGDNPSDDKDNPQDLQDWSESHGTVDEVHKPSRTRAGGNENRADLPECEDYGRPYEIEWPNIGIIDEFERNRIYEGNTFEWSMKLPKNSVDTIVTSPPYYALRDYDIDDAFPISGDFTCDHDWENNFCTKCGSFLGQLGHEPDPAMFIEHIVDLMERYKRVLKPTGSLWLNIGDTYAGEDIDGRVKAGEKSRMMIPERIYRRMVQTGWHLRDYVIWVKKIWMPDDDLHGNGKPFSGSSRLADQWEPMVRFTPKSDHYSDVDSNRLQPPSFSGDLGTEGIEGKFREGEDTQRGKTYNELGTNPPDVWLINSDGYDGDHRAVFPEQLPQRCINLSTPDRVCGKCGIPYEKEVHVEDGNTLSAGGDYATYEQKCHCDADHKPGVAFDPFLGSGTTAVAAANNGFDWAGTELSDKYIELARQRIPKGRQVGIDQW